MRWLWTDWRLPPRRHEVIVVNFKHHRVVGPVHSYPEVSRPTSVLALILPFVAFGGSRPGHPEPELPSEIEDGGRTSRILTTSKEAIMRGPQQEQPRVLVVDANPMRRELTAAY